MKRLICLFRITQLLHIWTKMSQFLTNTAHVLTNTAHVWTNMAHILAHLAHVLATMAYILAHMPHMLTNMTHVLTRIGPQMTLRSQMTHFLSFRQQQMANPNGNRTIDRIIPTKTKIVLINICFI